MLNAPADGHVLFLGTVSDAVVTPMAIAGAKYKAESLVLVNKLSESEFVLVARPALDIKDVADLVAQTKNRDMSYGSFGIGSLIHLVMEDFRAKTGASLLHVPYQGMSPVITAVMGGQIDLALLPIAGPTVNLIREGKVKPLFLTGSKRLPQLPNVPSADESALLRGFHHHIWPGIFVASATPKELVGKLNGIFAPIALSPEFRRFWDESGASITEPQLTVAQAARFYADDTARFRAIAQSIKATGVIPDGVEWASSGDSLRVS